MKILKKLIKKILPKFILKYIHTWRMTSFPVVPYKFSTVDARSVYNIILSGKLHHKSGEETTFLEKEFASYNNTKYAVSTNSGTSAIEMALKAIGIQPGDEVIVPGYTFVATAQAVLNRGGVPVFADIDDTFTISPKDIKRVLTKRTKAIIPVHIFGNVADMDAIMKIAHSHKIKVIEDACQAIGALYKGKKVGSIGDIGCFSFDSQKAIFTGQGGMLITSNSEFRDTVLLTRETGQLHDEQGSDVVTTGNTYALTEMQSALARRILAQLDNLNRRRSDMYQYFIQTNKLGSFPYRWYRVLPHATPSFYRLIFMIDFSRIGISRSKFLASMRDKGIPMRTFYPVPLYNYTLFQKRKDLRTGTTFPFDQNSTVRYTHTLPMTEEFCKQQVGLNWSPYIQQQHVRLLCYTLEHFEGAQRHD